ncbi:hypothetical protein AJ78_06577 [Emergomyces pasteurianus Ep9510]|uniref:Calcipressin n=1 Tax=Emergomyces pasteurianus Ep9510 TaxID=1447872 RepID=A0A1J9PA03_9EURO|nr:hypothetical protein AJ78_06577 [Emergomyces pasteurianus Ep9510]
MLPQPPTTDSSSCTSFSKHRAGRQALSLDLSNLRPIPQPSPPSNTLLITHLDDLSLFQPSSLDAIKEQISRITPLNSFSPLPSLRRIVCSFTSISAAIRIRELLDGEAILGKSVRARVYFGENTPVEDAEEGRKRNLLEAPKSQKLFFISPPPSPPHGWMMRNEEPPNKEVHAADLAEALGKLGTTCSGSEQFGSGAAAGVHNNIYINNNNHMVESGGGCGADSGQVPDTPVSVSSDVQMHGSDQEGASAGAAARTYTWPAAGVGRARSGSSTVIYDPEHHGGSPHLPAVMVEDTTINTDVSDTEMDISPMSGSRIIAHTSRPPVELMD